MFTKRLNDEQIKIFNKETGLKATIVFISKNKKYYYATIIDNSTKLRISKELANLFI